MTQLTLRVIGALLTLRVVGYALIVIRGKAETLKMLTSERGG